MITLHHISSYISQYGIQRFSNKILYLFGYLLLPLSYLFPRNQYKWVLGNKTGFSDNSKYLYLFLNREKKDIYSIWIAHSSKEYDDAKMTGFPVFYCWSFMGLWHCLTAGAYFFSSSVSDVNYWTKGSAKLINLWHGVGVKKLGYKGSSLFMAGNGIARIFMPYNYCQPTWFISTSELMNQHFQDCYHLSQEQVKAIGYPRCDYLQFSKELLFEYTNKYERAEVRTFCESLQKFKTIFVYMPTFRDEGKDIIHSSGINIEELNDIMKRNDSYFIIKLHPASKVYGDYSSYENVGILNKSMDMYPILPYTHILITDYSSIYYDYLLLPNRQTILFPFDYDDYIKNSRDLAYDYNTYTPGPRAKTWEELKQLILSSIKHNCNFIEKKWVTQQFWGNNYNNASNKIYELVIKNINK